MEDLNELLRQKSLNFLDELGENKVRLSKKQLEIYLNNFDLTIEDINKHEYKEEYLKKVSEVGFSSRLKNSLVRMGLYHIGAVVQCNEIKLLGESNYGKKSHMELLKYLNNNGLELRTQLTTWPPKGYEDLYRNFNPNS